MITIQKVERLNKSSREYNLKYNTPTPTNKLYFWSNPYTYSNQVAEWLSCQNQIID